MTICKNFILCLIIYIVFYILILHNIFFKNSNFNLFQSKLEKTEDLLDNELLKLRESGKLENQDEFIEEVLKEIDFTEVDLLSSEGRQRNSKYDEEIKNDLAKIIPGLGENGEGVAWNDTNLFSPKIIQEMKDGLEWAKVNYVLSQYIPLNRTAKDTRPLQCRNDETILFERNLPSMSIIMMVHLEVYELIIRTIHSIFTNTPLYLIEEIIIIDDLNTFPGTGNKLERYLVTQFPKGKIRLIRLKMRAGIIKGRMIGAHLAIGEVLMFTDSHVEFERDWAQPLLLRIKENPKILVAPKIERLEPLDFKLANKNPNLVFIFGITWDGWFLWIEVPEYELKRRGRDKYWKPTRSPIMHGAVFGINRKFFWEIGSFDPGMQIWGGENLELPLRVWICTSGSVEIIPCSIVYHMYKTHNYNNTINTSKTKAEIKVESWQYNAIRNAEVWMEKYKELVYQDLPHMRGVNYGDIGKRLALKKRLGCRNFQWFLDNFHKEANIKEFGANYTGRFYNPGTKKCLTKQYKAPIKYYLMDCKKSNKDPFQTIFVYNNVFRIHEKCWTTEKEPTNGYLLLRDTNCDSLNLVEQEKFEYNEENFQIKSLKTGKCLTVNSFGIILENCKLNSVPNQTWILLPFYYNDYVYEK